MLPFKELASFHFKRYFHTRAERSFLLEIHSRKETSIMELTIRGLNGESFEVEDGYRLVHFGEAPTEGV